MSGSSCEVDGNLVLSQLKELDILGPIAIQIGGVGAESPDPVFAGIVAHNSLVGPQHGIVCIDASNLVIEGNGLFEMQNCKIEEDCRLAVEGPGQVLLHVLKMMLYSGGWMSRVADNVLHTVRQPPKALAKKKSG